jgi:hypothetical protein
VQTAPVFLAGPDTLGHAGGEEAREGDRIDDVGVAEPEGGELPLAHPETERLAGDPEDADRLGAGDVGLPDGELLDDGGW